MNDIQAEIMLKAEIDKKAGFQAFISNPMISAMLSMVPPMENKDHLQVILKACFEAGYNSGVASVLVDILTHMTKREPK